jgi:hypothetical protein
MKGNADNNIYIKVGRENILIIQVYVDEIIFGSDDDRMSNIFSKDMHNEFEMSFVSELNLFFGLQMCWCDEGIFICQTKYIKEMLKKFGMEECKPIGTPMKTSYKLSK